MRKFLPFLAIAVIIMLAAVLRFVGVNWDENSHLHPDERFLTMVTNNTSWPRTLPDYFRTETSPLNPHNEGFSFYVYGTYPVYLTKFVAGLVGRADYDGITIVGRILTAVTDLLTVLLVFHLARAVSGRGIAGLAAAFLYAASVLSVQLSHFYTVDPYVTFFSTLTLYFLVRGHVGVRLGIAAALAFSAKASAVLLAIPVTYTYIAGFFGARAPALARKQIRYIVRLLAAALAFAATVRVFYPYLFSGWRLNAAVLDNWDQLSSFDGITTSFPPGIQWIGVATLQPLWDMIVWGFGLPAGLFVCVSVVWQAVIAVRSSPRRAAVPLILWVLTVLVYQSVKFSKPMRYFWPAYPALAVLAGLTAADIMARLPRRIGGIAAAAGIGIVLLWPVSYLRIYLTPHPRVEASRWLLTTVPPNTTVVWEHWDDPLPFAVKGAALIPLSQPQLPVFDPDTPAKWKTISGILTGADYIVVSSNRGYGAIGRAKQRFPETNRYYRMLFSGELGYTVVRRFLSRPGIPFPRPVCLSVRGFSYGHLSGTGELCTSPGIAFIDDYADETFTVYDHPAVTILRNTGGLSRDTLFERLSAKP